MAPNGGNDRGAELDVLGVVGYQRQRDQWVDTNDIGHPVAVEPDVRSPDCVLLYLVDGGQRCAAGETDSYSKIL